MDDGRFGRILYYLRQYWLVKRNLLTLNIDIWCVCVRACVCACVHVCVCVCTSVHVCVHAYTNRQGMCLCFLLPVKQCLHCLEAAGRVVDCVFIAIN